MDASITQRERGAMATTREDLDRVLEYIRAIPDMIPDIEIPRTRRDREKLVRKATLPPELQHAALVAIEDADTLLVMVQHHNPSKGREILGVVTAYDALADRLEQLARSVRHTADVRRAELGDLVLDIYHAAKRMGLTDPKVAYHADIMRKIMQKQRRRSAKRKAAALKALAEKAQEPA